MDAVQWVEYAGIELGNADRSLTYLRRGLGGPFNVTLSQTPVEEGDCAGFDELFSDTYEGYCAFTPVNLACHCDATSEDAYVSPAADPAPWWAPDRPDSDDFLGFMPVEVEVPSALARNVTPRSVGGGVVGVLRPRHRVVAVSGVMFAATRAGMAYGERWLAEVLAGTAAGCGPDTLRILPACPEDEADWDQAYREMHGAGIVDGPVYTPFKTVSAPCLVQQVSFQIAAGREHLQAAPVTVVDAVPLDTIGMSVCTALDGPSLVGVTAFRLTVDAGAIGSSVRGVTVNLRPSSGACPGSQAVTDTFTIDYIPRGGKIVIDTADRTVRVYDEDGASYGGLDSLSFSGLFDYWTAGPGQELCLCVSPDSGGNVNPGTMLTVQTILREI